MANVRWCKGVVIALTKKFVEIQSPRHHSAHRLGWRISKASGLAPGEKDLIMQRAYNSSYNSPFK